MKVEFKKSFQKAFVKPPYTIQEKFDERFLLFLQNPYHILLHNHSVHPSFEHGRSINVTADYRAIYMKDGERIIFTEIGTHSELYG